MFLPDVNVWLALAFESHIHHPLARDWFEAEAANGCAFCRLTQQGFLRLATNPAAFGEEAVTLAGAWDLYDALLADPRISFAVEPPGLETIWRQYTSGQTYSPKVWSDAYLAAFAQISRFRLVTLDGAFRQCTDLDCQILLGQ
jgi:toxin-antitoxin system PIN domain toxin